MDATTVGCNITAVTTVGRILSVLLAALGMMMFPIFTVYVTNILTKHHQMGQKYGDMNFTTPLIGNAGKNNDVNQNTPNESDPSSIN